MPPAVIDAMTGFRTALDAQDRSQSLRMAQAWLDITHGLDGELERLAMEATNARAAGRPLTLWHVSRMDRYQSLMRQVAAQMRAFEPVAVDEIAQMQALMTRWGIEHSQQLTSMQLPSIEGQFDRLPVETVRNMVGLAGDGTPLGRLLRRSWHQQAPDVARVLVRGVGLGWHPTRTARAMRDAVNVTLERAIVIARTETARVYREASRQQYIASRVVEGYVRIAAKSQRTCMACLMADGQFYELDVPFEEHVNGRCTSIPKVRGVEIPAFEKGEQWFLRQDAATQREMMGAGRYRAWRERKFDLSDLVTVHHDNVWGNSLQVTPLRALINGAGASGPSLQSQPVVQSPPAPQVRLMYEASAQQKAVVDQRVVNRIRMYARQEGVQQSDVRTTVEQVLKDLVENLPVSARFRSANLDGLRRSGRFLSQFETGTSGGALSPDTRMRAEHKGLGYPMQAAARERPIYGFFNINQNPRNAYWYGDLEFVFKEEIRERTTFTIGDSLGNFQYDAVYGAPVNMPQIGAADSFIEELMEYAKTGDKDGFLRRIAYVEAQMQGGVELGDVDYVVDHQQNLSTSDKDWLRSVGIGVR